MPPWRVVSDPARVPAGDAVWVVVSGGWRWRAGRGARRPWWWGHADAYDGPVPSAWCRHPRCIRFRSGPAPCLGDGLVVCHDASVERAHVAGQDPPADVPPSTPPERHPWRLRRVLRLTCPKFTLGSPVPMLAGYGRRGHVVDGGAIGWLADALGEHDRNDIALHCVLGTSLSALLDRDISP